MGEDCCKSELSVFYHRPKGQMMSQSSGSGDGSDDEATTSKNGGK